ncbi:MAG: ATP-dependent DNA helicase RecQ [Candidatus Limimorpha sp.]
MSELTRNVLKRYWGYPSFRPLQEDIVDSVISGRDTLALLPTGGGKSICFQVPAMAMEGVCIVVTPLISLMKDQVQHLKDINISARAIYSGMRYNEIELAYNQAVFGSLKFLYVSPERLTTKAFTEAVRRMRVCLLAIDESHCISQWGYDFRPPYLKIADIREYIPDTPVLALTATATPKVVEDIQYRLAFKRRNVFQSTYERKNVTYNVIKIQDKYGMLLRLFQKMDTGSGIVYVRSRKRTKAIAEWLQSTGISATFYHAGIDAKTRDERQKLWMEGKIKVIVATNAFGMGIDKPDVRLVVHMDLPDSLEAYFQEAGRAGRDLKPSQTYLLVSDTDIKQLEDNLCQSYPDLDRIKFIYDSIGNFLNIPIGGGENRCYDFVISDFAHHYQIPLIEVFNAIKLMESEGYFTLSEAMESPSEIMITAGRDDLFQFIENYKQYEHIISFLLRNYPGILSNFIKIDEESISHKLGTSVIDIQRTLKELESLNLLIFRQRNDNPQIQFNTERMDLKHFALSDEVYKYRKEDAAKRVQAVIDYVNDTTTCRSVQLLSYFGEKAKNKCGKCDVCNSSNNIGLSDNEYAEISKIICNDLRRNSFHISEAPTHAPTFFAEKVFETIRLMIDNGIIVQDKDGKLQNGRI